MKDVIKEIFKSNDFIGIDESFLSEKDLQFNLARMLENFGFKNVILEYPIVNKVDTKNRYKYIDIYCKKNNDDKNEYFIELKYKTKSVENVKRFGLNDLKLNDHSAHYDNRFYVYRDVAKLEDVVSKKKNRVGYVLFLTNEKKYQNENNKNFPLSSQIIKGKYSHRSYDEIFIQNNYNFEWHKFNNHDPFEYLLIEIK